MRKSIKSWFPIKDIRDGIIENKNGEFLKILEILPINFELKSIEEKETILYSYNNLYYFYVMWGIKIRLF